MRWIPTSARLFESAWLSAFADEVLAGCRQRCFGLEPAQFHRTGRFREELQRALAQELALREAKVDELVRGVAREVGFEPGSRLAVQHRPYARVVPPNAPDAVKDFHWDAYVGHPSAQWGLWVPLTEVHDDEALRLVDDEVTKPWAREGRLTLEAVEAMRAVARPVPMRVGEVLVMQSFTGHGSVPHTRDVTRLSFDIRFARAGEQPKGALGWKHRELTV